MSLNLELTRNVSKLQGIKEGKWVVASSSPLELESSDPPGIQRALVPWWLSIRSFLRVMLKETPEPSFAVDASEIR